MAFTSSIFLFVCFPLWVGGYYLVELLQKRVPLLQKLRLSDVALVGISLFFYAWGSLDSAAWMVGMILLVFLLGQLIERTPAQTAAARLAVGCSVLVVTIGLAYFKYAAFVTQNLSRLFSLSLGVADIAAPLGISFITFSSISYFMDIYRRQAKAGTLLDAALYLSFFPKVISGPIERWKDFAPQVRGTRRTCTAEQFVWGIDRLLIGMGKKLILADTFGALIAEIQTNAATGMDMVTAWGAAFLYMLQLYYDFAGYSDMALGLSAMFGIRLKENFHFPYRSQSIGEFWRRWHISLGSWFREYLYIPLGGNRKGFARTLLNLFIVFLVTGIWHGAGWNYVLWGVINGVCVVAERCIRDKTWYQRTPALARWAVTMFIVLLSWQVFRLSSLSEIGQYFGVMFGSVHFEQPNFTWQYYFDLRTVVLMAIGTVGAVLFEGKWADRLVQKTREQPALFCLAQLVLLLIGVLAVLCMVNSTYSPFLYFQY